VQALGTSAHGVIPGADETAPSVERCSQMTGIGTAAAPRTKNPRCASEPLTEIVDGLIERLGLRRSAEITAGHTASKLRQLPAAGYLEKGADHQRARAPTVSASNGGELIGREDEMSLLRAFLAGAALRGGHLMWCGMPGVGKTAILDAAVRLVGADTLVLRAAGSPHEADIRFSGLSQLLRPTRKAIDELAPDFGRPLTVACGFDMGRPPDPQLVADAALALLREISTARRVLLVVDDLQCVDRATLATIHWLIRHCRGHSIGLLATYRMGASLPFDRRGLRERELGRLAETAASALVGDRFPTLPSAAHRWVLDNARGNPLALLELPKVVDDADPASRRWQLPPLTPPLSARYTGCVKALPEMTRRLLLLAALDATGELSGLRAASPGCDVVAELDPATHGRLITIDADAKRVIFGHPIVRSAVVELSTSEERRAAHLSLAAALTDQPDRHAWHLADAAVEPDERVAALLETAAHRAERVGNPVEAAWALSRSADLTPDPGQRARRLIAAADWHTRATGELQRASDALTEAGRLDPGSRSSLQSVIVAAFLALHGDGNVDLAHRTLTAAITGTLDGDEPMVMNAAMHAALLAVCRFGARAELWASYFRFVERCGADEMALWLLQTRTTVDPVREAPAALQHLDRRIGELVQEQDPNRIEQVAAAATYVDRVGRCRPQLLTIIENAGRGRAVTTVINAITHVALDDLRSGRWDDAQTRLEYGLDLCQAKDFRLLGWPLQFGQAMLSAARGDTATAERLASDMTRWAARTGAHLLHTYTHHTLALCALGRGDYQTAYEHAAAITAPGTFPANVAHALWVAFDLVEAAVRSNKPAAARSHVRAMQEMGISNLSPRLRLVVGAAEAMAAPAEECVPLFDLALALPEATKWPFEHARLQLIYGERLRRARAIAAARTQLASALATFQLLNAVPWAAHAEAELLAAGVTGARPDVLPKVVLTPQERRVAALGASGMSNKQIAQRLAISPRTVSTHLQQVFPKLAINSRAALRAALSHHLDSASDRRAP
jgi:DNA-binding CsgD family transcriptional regulator